MGLFSFLLLMGLGKSEEPKKDDPDWIERIEEMNAILGEEEEDEW